MHPRIARRDLIFIILILLDMTKNVFIYHGQDFVHPVRDEISFRIIFVREYNGGVLFVAL
jgi:hypothetical protein